jgi:hypothetical protein
MLGRFFGYMSPQEDILPAGAIFNVQVTANSLFTAMVRLGTQRKPVSGRMVFVGENTWSTTFSLGKYRGRYLRATMQHNAETSGIVVFIEQSTAPDRDFDFVAETSLEIIPWNNYQPLPLIYAGYHKLHLISQATGGDPLGSGHGTYRVSSIGGVTGVLRLADGSRASFSSWMNAAQGFQLGVPLYAGLGAIHGRVETQVGAYSSDSVTSGGDLGWSRPANQSRRLYPDGFNTAVTFSGSRYVRQRGMSLFGTLGPDSPTYPAVFYLITDFLDIELALDISSDNKVVASPDSKLAAGVDAFSMTIASATGDFHGTMTILDVNPIDGVELVKRRLEFSGNLHQAERSCRGFGLLPDMPVPNAFPPVTSRNAPIRSVLVQILPNN